MEQITVTLNREALEQLPPRILVALLMGQQVTQPSETIIEQLAPVYEQAVTKIEQNASLFPTADKKVKAKFWTPAEDKKLLDYVEKGHQIWFIAQVFQCEKWQVEYRLEKLRSGAKQYAKRRWTRKDDQDLIYGVSKEILSEKELSQRLGRSVDAIKIRIKRLKEAGRL